MGNERRNIGAVGRFDGQAFFGGGDFIPPVRGGGGLAGFGECVLAFDMLIFQPTTMNSISHLQNSHHTIPGVPSAPKETLGWNLVN